MSAVALIRSLVRRFCPPASARPAAVASALNCAALLVGLAAPAAHAQGPADGPAPPKAPARVLQPLSLDTIAAALQRPVGLAMPSPRTSGALQLQGKRFYIAEYQLLVEVGSEQPAAPEAALALGRPVDSPALQLALRAHPDLAALQALTDRAWADLQARLAAAGVQPEAAATLLGQGRAVYEADAPASTAAAPVIVSARSGDTLRRYLVLAPSGMGIVPRVPGGLNPGNLAARLAFAAQGIEGLSLAIAVNLGGLDGGMARRSGFAGSAPALSPLMEVVPAPQAALVLAHGQLALVNLAEALVLAPEFGRLVPAEAEAGRAPADALAALLALGRKLGVAPGDPPRLDTLLELDGPATARALLYGAAAANQAIADALKAAR
ncbi:hypothetical protein [Aquabacterium sp. OR-4]|uniref:hypothetical protein n=1 Tax=Aquabacterium sp. OR-4 TaxID=2978127 RepID=UPI0021B2E4B5|nr:hypothetical protein [Aquabacterium sp. OR-4]MDT7834144.1 hypothetical protein [Aquabacterium sp. OR-4]